MMTQSFSLIRNGYETQGPGAYDPGIHGYPESGVPAAPFADPIPISYHQMTLPNTWAGGQGSSANQITRTYDPNYGPWYARAHFLGQGYYEQVPDGLTMIVTGPGTPNTHNVALRAGVVQNLTMYQPDPVSYSAAWVGDVAPTVVNTGFSGSQA